MKINAILSLNMGTLDLPYQVRYEMIKFMRYMEEEKIYFHLLYEGLYEEEY